MATYKVNKVKDLTEILNLYTSGVSLKGISTQLNRPLCTVQWVTKRYKNYEYLKHYYCSYSFDELINAINTSLTWAEACLKLGGKRYRMVTKMKDIADFLGCDYSHLDTNTRIPISFKYANDKKSFESWLDAYTFEGKRVPGPAAKKGLLAFNYCKEECSLCGQGSIHNGLPLTLQLDHIDGNPGNNNVNNLRFLCPNCHTQQKTSFGRGANFVKTMANSCVNCNSSINENSTICSFCLQANNERIVWPSKEELEILVWEKPRLLLSKELGVSDVAIAKRCRKLNINQPPRGYWAKLQASTPSVV
jgi:hypothetical protein